MENSENYEREIQRIIDYDTLVDIKNAHEKIEEIKVKIKEMENLSKRYKKVIKTTIKVLKTAIKQWEIRKE